MARAEMAAALAVTRPSVSERSSGNTPNGKVSLSAVPVPGLEAPPKSQVATFMPGLLGTPSPSPVFPGEPRLSSQMPGLAETLLLKLPTALQHKLPENWLDVKLHPNLHETAQHEFRHAFVAWQLGVPVLEVSVEPGPMSWGHTIVAPGELKKSQIISMAGKIPTDFGAAQGTSSDEHQAMMGTFRGGLTVRDAFSAAESAFRHCSPQLQEIAVRMITLMGTVSGSEFAQIMHHAAHVMHQKELISTQQYEETKARAEFNDRKAKEFGPLPGKTVTVIDVNDGVRDVVYVENGPKEKRKCPNCGTTGSTHFSGCASFEDGAPIETQTPADSVARRSARVKLLNGGLPPLREKVGQPLVD